MDQNVSAGIIPVIFKEGEPRFLLLRVYQYWDFPKGLVERSEFTLEAAIRELKEETGILESTFAWGTSFYETEAYSNNKVARYYIARVKTEAVELKRNEKTGIIEHHEFRWCTYTGASDLLGSRVRKALEWAFETITG